MNITQKGIPTSPSLVLFAGILAVSSGALFIRLAQREAGSLAIAAYRLTLASLVLLPFAWKQREEFKQLSRKQIGLLALSGLFLAGHFAAWITSLEFTSVASSVVLVDTLPLWVALLSPVFLSERLTSRLWFGLVMALIGGILVGLSEGCQVSGGLACDGLAGFSDGSTLLGNGLALLGAWFVAGYMIIGRKLRPHLSLTSYISAVYSFASVALLIMVAISGQEAFGFSSPIYLWLICLALIPQLLGHSSYNYALGYLPAAYVSVAILAEPISATLLAALILGELPTVLEVVGGLVILAGIGVATWKR